MLKPILAVCMAGVALGVSAAEIRFDFSQDTSGQPPPGFVSLVTGPGEPAQWKVTEEIVPPILAPIEPNAPTNTAKHNVLRVQSFNLDEDHFPILLFTNEIFSDFTFTTRFKIAGGVVNPSAGVVFRAQDQNNYYVVRASTEGNLLWYKVVDGRSYASIGIGVKLPMPANVWRELRIDCQGSQTRCYLDGQLVIPPVKAGTPTDDVAINDTTFSHGKVGFWSEADSKCFFVDGHVQYTPRVPYVQIITASIIKRYPRLLGLKVYANKNPGLPVIIGAINDHDLGVVGTKTEADVIARGSIYYLKGSGTIEITLPLRDRNGDIVAALAVKMKSFHGETEETALTRAVIVKKAFEEQIQNLPDLSG
jgi:hypothetical protein